MRDSSLSVLVTGARLPAALALVRALSSAGARAHAGDSLRCTTAGFSRFALGRVHFPSPALDFAGFRRAVLAAVERHRFSWLFPVSEEIFFLAQMRDELLARGARLFAPPLPLLRELHSKWGVGAAIAGCGASLPESRLARNTEELARALGEIPQAVLKPEYSRGAYETMLAPPTDISRLPVSALQPWVVQARVAGRELTTYSVAHEGEVLAHAAYEPLYRVGAGASLYFKPCVSPPAEEVVRAFARKHRFTGQVSFDWIEGPRQLWLLECNPRATSGAHLVGAGFGDALLGRGPAGSLDSAYAAKLGVMSLHARAAWREGTVGKLRADLRRARDSSFSARDPWPALGLPLSSCEILWRARGWRVPASRAFTYDLEWNGVGR